MTLGLGIPPRYGEADAAYTADVRSKLGGHRPWYDWRYGQMGADGYTPMLYDGNVERMAHCAEMAQSVMPMRIFLFNEPCRTDQANMTPQQAAGALRQWGGLVEPWVTAPYVGGVNVSVHHGDAPYEWLDAFVDAIGHRYRHYVLGWHIHAYGPAQAFCEAIELFRLWMTACNMVKPVIVSECGTDDNPAALMATIEGMLARGEIEAAYWFSAYWADWNETGLLDAGGNLTAIGRAFVAERETVHLPAVMG